MALIKCPECGKEISEKATSCPHCGNPINEVQPVIVQKDYKNKAKAFTITGVCIFIISGIIGIGTTDMMLGLKAQYVIGRGGAYPIYNFLINALTYGGLFLIVIGIIYWIIYAANKKSNKQDTL